MQSTFSANFNRLTTQSLFGALLIALGFLNPTLLNAQTDVSVDAKVNGTLASTVVTDPAVRTVSFHTVAKGNLSQFVTLHANGPSGLQGYVEIRQITRNEKRGPVYRLQFAKKKKGFTTVLVDGSKSALVINSAAATDPTQEQVDRIKKATGLSETVVRILLRYNTEEEIIAAYGKNFDPDPPAGGSTNNPTPENPTPKTEPGILSGISLLSKDACDASATAYDLTFVVDLSGVDRAAAGSSFTVSATIQTGLGKGSAASIKPVSDGKFAPRPLILIQSPGYGSTTALNLVKWKNGRPGQPKALKIEDYISYRGQSLARALATSVLSGGKGTFEISNGTSVGTACFSLIRARQKANGYKGGD